MNPLKCACALFLGLLVSLGVRVVRPDAPPATRPVELGLNITRDIQYADPDNHPQLLDLYLPKNHTGSLPVIVTIHGGGWIGGDKRATPAAFIARQGYAVASINYRLTDVAPFPAQIEDCKAAIRWVRANAKKYHFDPDHVGVFGDSAGGHLVALLGTTAGNKALEGDEGNPTFSSKVQAVCDLYGPTDLLTIFAQEKFPAPSPPDDPNSPVTKLLGGPTPENKDKAIAASPITYVTKNAAPFLIFHGDNDPIVPLAQSKELVAALKKAGVEVELYVVKGGGHGFAFTPKMIEKTEKFFARHLKPKEDGK